jgi:hypothetical protein
MRLGDFFSYIPSRGDTWCRRNRANILASVCHQGPACLGFTFFSFLGFFVYGVDSWRIGRKDFQTFVT